jgi:WD40 repeat protein
LLIVQAAAVSAESKGDHFCQSLLALELANDSRETPPALLIEAYREVLTIGAAHFPERFNAETFRRMAAGAREDRALLFKVPPPVSGVGTRSIEVIKAGLTRIHSVALSNSLLEEAAPQFLAVLEILVRDGERELARKQQGHRGAERPNADGLAVRGGKGTVFDARLNPAGDRLLVAQRDGIGKIFDLYGNLVRKLIARSVHTPALRFYRFLATPTGDRLVTTHGDQVRIWDGQGNPVQDFGSRVFHWEAQISPNGALLWTGGQSDTYLWDLNGNLLHELEGNDFTWFAAFSPDGQWIALGCRGKELKIYRTDSTPHRNVRLPREVSAIAFSPDSKSVLVGLDNRHGTPGVAELWDLDGNRISRFGHPKGIMSVEFSHDGKRALIRSRDDETRLWNIDGTLIKVLREGQEKTRAIYDLTRNHALTGGTDGAVRAWNSSGELVGTIAMAPGPISSLWISQDGKHLVTGTEKGWVTVHELDY